MTPNPKRLYETERKRQQRARLAEGQVHRVAVYLTDNQRAMLDRLNKHFNAEDGHSLVMALIATHQGRTSLTFDAPRQTPPTQR